MPKSLQYILFILCAFTFYSANAQLVYYQDSFRGGVTGGGFNPAESDFTGEIELFIEPGSSVRRALLLVGNYNGSGTQRILTLNGSLIALSSNSGFISNPFTASFLSFSEPLQLSSLIIDVTESINIAPQGIVSLSIQPPSNQPLISSGIGRYVEYFLFITYEHNDLEEVSTIVLVNELMSSEIMSYTISNLNPIDMSKQMGLAIHGSQFCNVTGDGSYVSINGQPIGLIGGKDANNIGSCSGPTGTFYYQNQGLYGLNDDTANVTMNGSDALADISPYIADSNSVNIRFDYQMELPPFSPRSNPIWQLFFAYTSTCPPFETTLTERITMCASDSTAQLLATGGESYEWWPAEDLSCADCPTQCLAAAQVPTTT